MALNCDIYTFVVCRFFLLSIVSCGHFYCCLLVVWHILIAACVGFGIYGVLDVGKFCCRGFLYSWWIVRINRVAYACLF